MKNLKKYLGIIGLVFAAMMFTSCKTIIGETEMSGLYITFAVLAIIAWLWVDVQAILAPAGKSLKPGSIVMVITLIPLLLPFFIAPNKFFSLLLFGISVILAILSYIIRKAIWDADFQQKQWAKNEEKKAKATAEAKLKTEEEAKAKAEAEAKAKAEAETKAKAEAEEKAKKLSETKAVLSQMESDLEAKKAELASLGLDAQDIVRKAALNKEIKELEPQIETLKAEVERLSK